MFAAVCPTSRLEHRGFVQSLLPSPSRAWKQVWVRDGPGLILWGRAELPIAVLGQVFEASVGRLQYGEGTALFGGLAVLWGPRGVG